MIGTLINAGAVVVGSLIGLLLGKGIPKRISDTIMKGLGLSVILIGLQSALETKNTLLVIFSLALGGGLGALLNIRRGVEKLGAFAQRKLTRNDDPTGRFANGFVTASLLFCVGAMGVVGALNSGIQGDHSMLVAKALLDGVTSILFASTMGAGVMLSALAIFVYQGAIALLGSVVAPLLSEAVIREMSAVGGLMVLGIGVNLLLDKDLPIADMLPAVFIPILYYPIAGLF